jgi:hypothetical protein
MYCNVFEYSELDSVDEYERINNTLEFIGIWSRLKKIFAENGLKGTWDDLGVLKVFTPADRSPMYYWWSDSGDITRRAFIHKRWLSLTDDILHVVEPLKNGSASEKKWTTFSTDRLGEVSLPQLAILFPHLVFEDDFKAVCKSRKVPIREYYEVRKKGHLIRIPGHQAAGSVVVHRSFPVEIDPEDARGSLTYAGFQIMPAEREIERGRCELAEAGWIDLGLCQHFIDQYDGSGTTSSFMNAIGPNDDKAWSRRRCESFFNNDDNFVSVSEASKLIRDRRRPNIQLGSFRSIKRK